MSAIIDDGCIGCPNEKHLNSGDQSLIVLPSEIRDREVLLEQFSVESSCVLGDRISVIVLNGKEELGVVEFGFVILVCFDFGGSN